MREYTGGVGGRKVLITYLTIGGSNVSVDIGRALEGLDSDAVSVVLRTYMSEDTIRDPKEFRDMIRSARGSALMIMNFHGDPSGYKLYDGFLEELMDGNISTFVLCNIREAMDETRRLFHGDDSEYRAIVSYLRLGGPENMRRLAAYLVKICGDPSIACMEPVRECMQGLWHPDIPDMDMDSMLARIDPKKPTVGVLIPQPSVIHGRTGHHALLIHAMESMGANVIPVFLAAAPDAISGSEGGETVIRRYFMDEGRRRVDSVVLAGFGFSFLTLCSPGDGSGGRSGIFEDLNVPVLGALGIFRPQKDWEEDGIGMQGGELAISVALPELDGQLTTVPYTFNETDADGRDIVTFREDRIGTIAAMAVRWARVSHVPVSERKVSILFNGGTLSNGSIGAAGGLDTFESVCSIMRRMADAGYTIDRIPSSGREIIDEMLAAITNNLEWVEESDISSRATDLIDCGTYEGWAEDTEQRHYGWVCKDWGQPPGDIMTHDGRFIVPGVRNGNVYLGMEPNRGKHDKAEQLIHDPDLSPPHQYLAYYRWISRVFGTDIHVHMGTHGSCEWLPGKGNGLSAGCSPDIMMEDMPHLYAYVIDDPSEGIVAKRRKKAVLVDHMMPALTRAGTYEGLGELEGQVQQYLYCKQTLQYAKMKDVATEIHRLVSEMSMWKELGLEEGSSPEKVAGKSEEIMDYIADLKDGLITDGLHIMGKVPEGRRMVEMVYCLTRLRNGRMPSLRHVVAESMGFDLDLLLDDPSGSAQSAGELNCNIVDRIDSRMTEVICSMQAVDFDPDECASLMGEAFPGSEGASILAQYITEDLVPRIRGIADEVTNMLRGMDGGFVPPGPSGSPTRGNAHLLPTGKNYYSLDPETVPTQESWRTGSRMAEDMVSKYVEREGRYPESIAIVVWSVDTMKTGGDDVAYILRLLGVRPTWGSVGGKVTGLEIIPTSELERPRIDVTVRISSLFRDTFPNLFELIDEAVSMVCDLEEDDDNNFLRKHLREDMARMIEEGMSLADARDNAMIRVFGEPPGTHGAGVNILVESSKWDSIEDLAQIYVTCGCSAYGRRWRGEKKPELFRHRIEAVDVAVKNQVDREFDLVDVDDGYSYLGGMNAIARAAGKGKPVNYVGDSSDPDRIKTRDLEGEVAYILRSRVLNPKWIEGLKEHGFVGANLIHDNINHTYGWDCTSDVIEKWMYDAIAERFVLDDGNREWIEKDNPYAMRDILDDLLEAVERGLWDADQEMRERLEEVYLEVEGMLEEVSEGR